MKIALQPIILSLITVISASSAMAKKFIYDDQTRTYTEIRDDRYPNNGNQYQNNQGGYNNSYYDDNRYIYNGNQRIDKTMQKPTWDWKVGQSIPSQYRAEQFQVKHTDSPRLYPVGSDEQWYKVNGDYVLADDDYEILRIMN